MEDEDVYDFSDISLIDLQQLLPPLMTSSSSHLLRYGSNHNNNQSSEDDDDDEWYPPSPPIYDVTEKLIEINRTFLDDPTPSTREANKLRWKPGSSLVQV